MQFEPVLIEDVPYFNPKDVYESVGRTDYRKHVETLPSAEYNSNLQMLTMHGMLKVVFGSRGPKAAQTREWVTCCVQEGFTISPVPEPTKPAQEALPTEPVQDHSTPEAVQNFWMKLDSHTVDGITYYSVEDLFASLEVTAYRKHITALPPGEYHKKLKGVTQGAMWLLLSKSRSPRAPEVQTWVKKNILTPSATLEASSMTFQPIASRCAEPSQVHYHFHFNVEAPNAD